MCLLEPTTLAIMSGVTIINDYPTCNVPVQKCLRWGGAEGGQIIEMPNSETSDSLYGLYIMGRLFGPRVVIQCIV